MVAWNGPKTKVQLKLSSQRCALLQEKKNALVKKERREIASLIERGKLETARIKTEGLIGEDIAIELLEIMELYMETLIARFALLELPSREPDAGIREPLCAIIHAAPRIELREMHALREMLMTKYGREFAVAAMENTDNCVGDRVISRLRVATPDKTLVDMYIAEICKTYDVAFTSPYLNDAGVKVDQDQDDDIDQIPSPKPHAAADGPLPQMPLSSEAGISTKSDLGISKAAGIVADKDVEQAGSKVGNGARTASEDDKRYEELQARFAALKRRS